MNYDTYKFSQYQQQYNETRWAKESEIQAATTRISIGKDNKYAGLPIMNDGVCACVDHEDNHSLIFGSTGSKKTRLFAMPTLRIMIDAGESFIVTDPKAELYEMSSGAARAKGYRVIVLNYRDLEKGDNWNPLSLPYDLYHNGDQEGAISRINDFVNAISEKQMSHTNDIFWVNAAKSVALAILITMLDCCTKEECNLKTFTRFCTDFAKGTSDPLMAKAMGVDIEDIDKNYLEEVMKLAAADSIARINFEGVNSSSDKARGDIQSTLFTLIAIFLTQEALVRNMGRNSFDLNRISKEKTALYLIVPDERTNYHFIATTFIKQCYESLILNAQLESDKKLPIRVNFILDEFANIPKVPDMPSMISAGRSRNIRFYLVVQSMHQLKEKYQNEAETIKGNCENWVFLSSKEIELLHEISALAGTVSRSVGGALHNVPLISISQLQRLDKQSGEALIFCGRQYPFITKMADISDCSFQRYDPVELIACEQEDIKSISAEILYEEIMDSKRNIPFRDVKMEDIKEEDESWNIDDVVDFDEYCSEIDEECEDDYENLPYEQDEHALEIDRDVFAFYEQHRFRYCIIPEKFQIVENEDDEIAILCVNPISIIPKNPVLYVDGVYHAVLIADNFPVVVYNNVNKDIYSKLTQKDEVLCSFMSKELDVMDVDVEHLEINCEFYVRVQLCIHASKLGDLFIGGEE